MKYKTTHKDRYGNMRSLEIDTGENNMEVPPMTSMIPQYEAVGGLAENHPGEPKGSDTVPAWLTPGEFVVNKEATDLFGPQIKQMNDIGREIQDGNVSPSEVNQIPMYAKDGKKAADTSWITGDLIANLAYIESDNIHRDDSKKGQYGYDHTGLRMSEGGAYGKYQWTIKSAANPGYGIEGFDPREVTEEVMREKTVEYLKGIQNANPDWTPEQVLRAYNQGPGKTREMITGKWDNDPRSENYGKDILNEDGTKTFRGMGLDSKSDGLWGGITKEARDYPFKVLSGDKNATMYGTEVKNKDGTVTLKNFPESMLPVSKPTGVEIPTNMPSPFKAAQDGWRSVLDIFKRNSANDNVQAIDNAANINEAGGVPHTEMIIPELPVSKPKPEVFNYDKPLKKRGMQDGGVVHAWMGQKVPRYFADLQDNELEDYLNQYVIPQAENLIYKSGAGGGDGDDLGHVPYDMPPAANIPVSDWNADPNKITPPLNLPVTNLPFGTIDDMPKGRYGVDNVYSPKRGSEPRGFEEDIMGAIEETQDMLGPVEYSDRHPGAGPMPPDIPNIPVSDWNADPDKLNPPPDLTTGQDDFTTNAMNKVPVSNEFAMDPNDELSNLGQQYDSTSMTSVPGDMPNPFEGYAFSDTKPFDNAYDQMVKKELEGSPAYSIPFPFPDYRPDEQVGMEGIPTFTDKHEGAGPTTAEDVVPVDTSIWRDETSAYNHHFDAKKYQTSITKALNQIDKLRKKNPNDPKINELRENITKWEERRDYHKKAEASIRSSEKRNADNKKLHKDAELLNKIVDLEKYINSESITQSEKERAQEQLDILNAQYKETELSQLTTDLNAGEKQLKEVVKNNHIDNKKEDEISAKLSSKTGGALMESESNDPNKWGKAEEMLKGTLGFLFGDIFDSKELGRAIAVYLGSRALGYEHGESIGYVAKQYLKRVDAKNAAYDKWLLANASKYDKKSLSKFKKTRDPAHLIPIGSVPRSQGEQSKWYNKDGKARMAYKFKIKDGSGDDHIYWSWDKDGKSEVEEGWHQDPKSVPGTTEFKAEAKKYRDDIEEQLRALLDQYDISQARDPDKNIYENKYHTDIMPAIDKDAVYDWAIDKGVQPEKIGSFLQQAMILATKEARESGVDKPNTILPYLDRVTIDEQTANIPKLLQDGDYELDTSEAAALNKKIKENFGSPTIFYNSAWEEYQKGKKDDGTPWPEVFKELAADDANEANWTPFALFVDNLLYEWMKEHKAKRHSGDFTLNTYGKD